MGRECWAWVRGGCALSRSPPLPPEPEERLLREDTVLRVSWSPCLAVSPSRSGSVVSWGGGSLTSDTALRVSEPERRAPLESLSLLESLLSPLRSLVKIQVRSLASSELSEASELSSRDPWWLRNLSEPPLPLVVAEMVSDSVLMTVT